MFRCGNCAFSARSCSRSVIWRGAASALGSALNAGSRSAFSRATSACTSTSGPPLSAHGHQRGRAFSSSSVSAPPRSSDHTLSATASCSSPATSGAAAPLSPMASVVFAHATEIWADDVPAGRATVIVSSSLVCVHS